MEAIRVAIADDNERILELLDEIIRSDNELKLVGKADNGEDICTIIREKEPDVVLLDLIMPKMDGLTVMDHVSQNLSGILLIISHLGTAIGMSKCNHILHIASDKFLCLLFQCLGNGIDTSYRRNNPDLIADTNPSVCSAVSVKICMGGFLQTRGHRLILILQKISQSRL